MFRSFSGNQHTVKAANSLSMDCHSDAKSIRNCAECFQFWVNDRFLSFTKVCSTPHMPVFAKVGTFPFWPAKVMSVEGHLVNVEFFGDHSQAFVESDKCLLYAVRLPGRKVKSDEYKHAMKVRWYHFIF